MIFPALVLSSPASRPVCAGTFGRADLGRISQNRCLSGKLLSSARCWGLWWPWAPPTLRQHLLLTFFCPGEGNWLLVLTRRELSETLLRAGFVSPWIWQSPLCARRVLSTGKELLLLSLSACGGFVQFTLGWAPPCSINPAFCLGYFCSGSLADPRRAVLDLVPK